MTERRPFGSRQVLVLGGILAFALLVLALLTFLLARPRYLATKATMAQGVAEIEKARASWSLPNAEPLETADPAAVEEHARQVQTHGRRIEGEVLRLRQGERMFFWYFWCRGREADAFQASIDRERGVAAAGKTALAAVHPLRVEVAGWLASSAGVRSRADARLIPASDEEDFTRSANELKRQLGDLSGKQPALNRARTTSPLTGLPERYRLAMLTWFERQLDGERAQIEERIDATSRAISLLREYKAAMADTLEGSGNVILALETLGINLLPLADVTFQATHPVHEAILSLKQPIGGESLLKNLTSGLPMAARVEITPFAILSQLNPQVGKQIETIETVCEVIGAFHEETSRVVATIPPFAGSLREFVAARSRDGMDQVLEDLPGAVDTLSSLAARVDGALGELERARIVTEELQRIVGPSIPQPYVRDLVEMTASAADGLVRQASEPFVELKERLQGTAASLLSLEEQEEFYQRQLEALRSPAESGNQAAEETRAVPIDVADIPVEAEAATEQVVIFDSRGGSSYSLDRCGAISDLHSALEWYVGPDRTMSWYEAKAWIERLGACGGGWRMPTLEELRSLYEPSQTAGQGYYAAGRHWPAHMNPVFEIGQGSWVWAADTPEGGRAKSFNFNQGVEASYSPTNAEYTTRAFAVRGVEHDKSNDVSQ